MKKMLLGTLLACTAASGHAFDQQGIFVGGGSAAITFEDCSSCDSTGLMLEMGFDINSIAGIELKVAQTSSDDYDNLDLTYIGTNLGSDFGTHWFKLYGKLGLARIKESAPGYLDDTDTNIALGVGVRFTPVQDQRGFYIKLEGLSTRYYDWDLGIGMFSLGYKF